MPLKFPLGARYITHSIPCTHFASMNSGALIYSFRSVPVLSKAFPFRLKYLGLVSRVNFSTRPETTGPEFGRPIRASKSLIEDEAELSDWVSDLRTSSMRGKFTSDEDNSGPEVVRRNVDRNNNDRGPRRGREGVSDRFGGSRRGLDGEGDRFGGSNRRRTSSEPAGSFRNKRLGDREGVRNGRSSESSLRGRNERNVDSGFRRERGLENNRGLGKQTRGLREEEEDSSDEDEKRVVLGSIDDLLSEDSSDEDDIDDEPLIKKAASAKAVETDKPRSEHVKTSDCYLSKTRFDQFPLSPLSLKAIKDAGFETMTVVQEATLPIILKGKDVLAKAKTGTGKTVAFLLPSIEAVLNSPPASRENRQPPIIVLVVCPTRELASQAAAEANTLLKYHPSIGVQVVIGGTKLPTEQRRMQTNPCQERMTLKHKNTGKWAKRMRSRGLDVKYDETRAAIDEQLEINATLSRKMNSIKDESSSDEEELNDGSDEDTCKLIAKAKEKTLKTMEDDEVPISGLLSLPFMARAMKKKNEEANEEAKRALEEYEEWENSGIAETPKKSTSVGGRRVFGAAAKVEAPKESKKDSDNFFDSDSDMDGIEDNDDLEALITNASAARNIVETEMTGCKNAESIKASKTHVPISQPQDKKESRCEESDDSESEAEQMVDGVLTSASNEIPSQAEIVNRAFAGDDVVDEFDKDKQKVLNQEVPQPEKLVLVPGWGQWTNVQNKRGLPSWMVRENEDAKKRRKQLLKTRKDAPLRHVIISEKVDKKAEKLYTETVPFPHTSKEVYEQSMRMPIGPDFNPKTVVGEHNRPEVVKKAGVIIKPVKFEEVDPNEKVDDQHSRSHRKQKIKKGNNKNQ